MSQINELVENIKKLQLDDLYIRFMIIAARELVKVERSAEAEGPMAEDYLKRFETLARVTRDISTELRAYQKDRVELSESQMITLIKAMLKEKPEIANAVGITIEAPAKC